MIPYPHSRADIGLWLRRLVPIPLAALVAGAGVLFLSLRSLPTLDNLDQVQPSFVTRLYDKHGTLAEELYAQRRIYLPIDSVPPALVEAVLAVEDRSFYRHWGVDLSAIPAAALQGLGGRMRGASTLTQQLAKNLFLTPERSLARKVKEILVAVRIEQTYTKREILEMYFNQVYLGGGAYGFQAASERYFSRPLDSLGIGDYALLAGLLQRPEFLRPDRFPEEAVKRRNIVLGAMADCGFLTSEEVRAESAKELRLEPREELRLAKAPYFSETVRLDLAKRWGEAFLDSAGLDVQTTLDLEIQRAVDGALARGLERLQSPFRVQAMRDMNMARLLKVKEKEILADWSKWYPRFDSLFLKPDSSGRLFPRSKRYRPVQGAVVVIDNATGGVTALAGGENFFQSGFNRAVQARRQPGSAFKPLVYAAAVESGEGPGSLIDDHPIAIPDPSEPGKIWEPGNFEQDFEGVMTFRRALYRSRNIPSVIIAQETGLENVAQAARRFGLTGPIKPLPSLGVGAVESSLLEMTSAYSVFPNEGLLRPAYFLENVKDRNGNSLYRNVQLQSRAIKIETAWMLADMLVDVNVKGTGYQVWAEGFRHPSGGKTGTTNDYRDAWYIGFTRQYTTGVWVGFDDFSTMGTSVTGTSAALPIWLDIMKKLHHDLPHEDFSRPESVEPANFCALTGKRAQSFCDSSYTDWRMSGGVPWEDCVREAHGFWRKIPGVKGVKNFFRRIFGD